ncbi:hypothetical protein [Kordia sp.]|uniref:hypothetical protein n=1 Tax=Kordia sp. TaxID=1965332 RepID=UPI003B591095
MKRNLFYFLLFITSCVIGQTNCLFDETKFSGTVTTTTVGATKFKASDASSNHRFGERVAIDGNIAAVVSRSNASAAGKVYIYTNDGSGNWTQQTILTASDSFSGDNFGSAVALEGNYLVVGARSQLDAMNVDTGAAYVFEYNGVNTWTEVAILKPSDGTSGDRFGEAVSIEGDLILVGARNGCTGGCAYLYENDGTNTFTYTETKLEPQVQSNYDGARFGYDVLIKNGRAYVGGPQDYSSVGNASAGSVQIWDQANDGTWSRTHRLQGTQTSEYFGCSISVEGDYLAIGAYNFEVSSTPDPDQGRVYVYKADTNGDYLEANSVMIQNDDKDSYNDQRFGTDLMLDGEFLYVGTFGNGSSNTDAVYIFKDDGTNTWTQLSKITSGAGWDEFSNRAVAVSYPTLLIGQNEDDSPSNSGAVYFVSLESTITPTASVTGVTDVYIGQTNGVISVNFDDEATRSEIKFSIDGGTTYPYVFNDDVGNADITNLAQGSYELRATFEEGSCVLNLGTVTVNQLPYTTIPDANFEAALEALGYDDISSDGQVPTDYISGITSLDLNNQNISDLTGINDFAALETLRIQYNNLTSLDVSNLVNLKTLWAANGNAFSSLDVSNNTLLEDFRLRQYSGTSIDLAANTALTRFACDSCDLLTVDTSTNVNLSYLDLWNSEITSLDLSANTNLATLDVYSTKLTTLDVTANTLLTNLIANDITTLTSLDVRNGNNININTFNITSNSNLDCVFVDDATYSTTNWTQIDSGLTFSENYCRYTAIPDANFEAVLNTLGYDDITADGQVPTELIEVITALDVSNQNIADLSGIEDFSALIDLNVETNLLTSLDVSNNSNLQTLIFDNNTVSTLNLGAISGLTSIEGRYNQLTAIDLSLNPNLTFINLRDNLFTTVVVSNNPLLETINLRGCTNLTTIDLTNNTNVKSLFFQDTALNGLDVSQNILLENVIIERVNFNSIDVSNLPNLVQLRIADNNFTELDISNNPALVRLECENNNLTYLNLKNGNNTNMPNADFIATGNPNLTCILVDDATWSTANWTNIDGTSSFNDVYCRYTTIPDANFEAELEALGYDDVNGDGQVPTALIEVVTSLDVQNKSISDLTGIEDFTALITLDVDRNNLTQLNLTNNIALETLSANQNDITSIDISQNVNLQSVDLGANQLTSLDVSANTALTRLDCPANDIVALDVSNNISLQILEAFETDIASIDLSANVNLQKLRLYKTDITEIDVTNNPLLNELRIDNTDVSTLDITNNLQLDWLKVNGSLITSLDLTGLSVLTKFEGQTGVLEHIDIRNGNNTNITTFNVTNNNNLNCVSVDAAAYSTTNWTQVDSGLIFSENYCRYTAIPDANFEAALEALGYDDISADGQVPTALIEGLTQLTINFHSIVSLGGIEAFTALEELDVLYGSLTAIDVSQNLNLKILKCGYNIGINSLDISNNLLLEELVVNDTSIPTLDLSPNINLTNLVASSNSDLVELNVQNGNNTNITNFFLVNSPNLTCIIVDDANYSTTNWTDIETTTSFSSTYCLYTSIPDANFEAALEALGFDDISADGQVPTALIEVATNVNVNNQGIMDITGIEDFIGLTSLNVSDNTIGTLDVSNSPNLVSLTANACGLTSLDISQNTVLETLSADSNQLTSINTTNNTVLRSVVLYGNLIATADFSTNTLLENLDLFQNKLTTLDLSTNTVLKTLFCDNNELISLNVQNGNNAAITTFNAQSNDDLYCILVDDVAYSTTNWSNKDAQASYNETSCDFVIVDIDVFLQGALLNPNTGEETLMRDDLRTAGAVYDAVSPYSDGASISLDVGVADNGVNSMVDWIWVELRDANSPTTVIAGQSGVLQRDGDIVDVNDDLVTPLTFDVPAGEYFIVVKHRNHLGIMTSSTITLKQVSTTIDFTDATNEITYGSNAQTTFGMPTNIAAMWAGNVNGDTVVQYSGVSPDTPDILSKVLNDAGNFLNFPTYVVSGYNADDVNLDGNTQYSGTDPDTPFILQNVLAHPGNFLNFSTYQIVEQLPDNE